MPRPKFEQGNKLGKGGPPGNDKAVKHGVLPFVKAGALPPGCDHIRRRLLSFSREIERELRTKASEIGIHQMAQIQTATRLEGRALLLARWLATAGEKLSPMEMASLSAQQVQASDQRDRLLARLLGSDGKGRNAIDDAWDDILGDDPADDAHESEQGIQQDVSTPSVDQQSQTDPGSAGEADRTPEGQGVSDV